MQSPAAPTHDPFLLRSYELIKFVAEHMPAIEAVASHLTPVEDLVEFQAEVTALHAKLGLLVTASELILRATPAGIDLLLAADAAAQRALLELGSAALKDVSYFASAEEFAGLVQVVDGIAARVATLETEILKRVTYDEQAAALAPILLRLTTLEEAVDALTAKVDGVIVDLEGGTYTEALTEQITHFGSRLTNAEGTLSGQADSIEAVRTRVTLTEQGIEAASSNITQLFTEVADLVTGQTALSGAMTALSNRTATLEGTAVSQAEAITVLQAQTLDLATGITANADAIEGLNVRVTQTENAVSLMAADVSQLGLRVVDAETATAATADAYAALQLTVEQNQDSLTIAGEDITALKAQVTSVGNLLPGSAFESLNGWTFFSRGSGWLSAQLQRNLEPERLPPGVNAMALANTGVPGGNAGVRAANIPVAGGRYILSGYVAAENCTARLEWRVLDGLGNQIGLGVAATATDTAPVLSLQEWPRQHAILTLPPEAALLQIQWWVTDAHDAPPKAWLVRPMLEEALGLQNAPSPWVASAAGIEEQVATAVQELTVRVEQAEDLVESSAGAATRLEARIGALAEWRVTTHMTSAAWDDPAVNSPAAPGLRKLGAADPAVPFTRGLTLVRFGVDGEVLSSTTYDTFSTPSIRTALATALNALPDGTPFLLVAQNHRGINQTDLVEALEAAGAFSFADLVPSRAYMLLGAAGIGKGGGVEIYPIGDYPYLDHTFTLVNDRPKGLLEQVGVRDAQVGLATAVDELTTIVTGYDDQISAIAASNLELNARVANAEAALTNELIIRATKDAVQAGALNLMEVRLTDAEDTVLGAASIAQAMDARVTATEDGLVAQAQALTALETEIGENIGTAVDSLTTRIDAAEDSIEVQSAQITDLVAGLGGNPVLNSSFDQDTSTGVNITGWNSGFASGTAAGGEAAVRSFPAATLPQSTVAWKHAITNLGAGRYLYANSAAMPCTPGSTHVATAYIKGPASLNLRVAVRYFSDAAGTTQLGGEYLAGNVAGNGAFQRVGGAVAAAPANALSMRVYLRAWNNGASTVASADVEFDNVMVNAGGTVLPYNPNNYDSLASARNALTTSISNTDGNVSALSGSLTTLTTTVNGHTSTISSHATSINGLSAKAGLTLDVNGYITGWALNNNGASGDMVVNVDKFKIVTPGASPQTPFEVVGGVVYIKTANIRTLQVDKITSGTLGADISIGAGKIIFNNGTVMKVQGLGFGTANQFIEWFGPTMAINQCSEANATSYLKTNGSAYFGGSLSAGILRNQISTTLLSATELILGPFSTNGNAKSVVCSFSYELNGVAHGGDYTGSYHNQPQSATVHVYRSVNNAAWEYLTTFYPSGGSDAQYISDDGYPGGSTYVYASCGGSTTLTDYTGATSNLRFRAVIAARNVTTGLNGAEQNLTLISTEQ